MSAHPRKKPGRRLMRIDPETFGTMRRVCGLTQPACADLLGVSLRTVQNWEESRHTIPWMAFKVLRLISQDEITQPGWDGWFFRRGLLWSPEQHSFNPTSLGTLRHVFDLNRHLNRQVEALKNPPPVAIPTPEIKRAAFRIVK